MMIFALCNQAKTSDQILAKLQSFVLIDLHFELFYVSLIFHYLFVLYDRKKKRVIVIRLP